MKNLDQKYLEDTLRMIRFLARSGQKKRLKKKKSRSGILCAQMCSLTAKEKVNTRLVGPILEKCGSDVSRLQSEASRLECMLEVVQRLNSAIQKSRPSRLMRCLSLLLEILELSDFYFIARKGLLIVVKIAFVLEQFELCCGVTRKLLNLASVQRDYSCLVSGWLKVAECEANLANFSDALKAYFQMLKFAIIHK